MAMGNGFAGVLTPWPSRRPAGIKLVLLGLLRTTFPCGQCDSHFRSRSAPRFPGIQALAFVRDELLLDVGVGILRSAYSRGVCRELGIAIFTNTKHGNIIFSFDDPEFALRNSGADGCCSARIARRSLMIMDFNSVQNGLDGYEKHRSAFRPRERSKRVSGDNAQRCLPHNRGTGCVALAREAAARPPSRTTSRRVSVTLLRELRASGRSRSQRQRGEPGAFPRYTSPASSALADKYWCYRSRHRACFPTD